MTEVNPPSTPIRVAVVDDHMLFSGGLCSYLAKFADIEVVAEVSRWEDFVTHPAWPAQVVLLDVLMHDNIPVSVKIRALTTAGAKVVVVSSMVKEIRVIEALEAGASAYLPKNSQMGELLAAIRAAAKGESLLTPALAAILLSDRRPTRPKFSPQEQRVLTLYAAGVMVKHIPRRTGMGYETVRTYLNRIRSKYEKANRPARDWKQLRENAIEDGWITEETNPDEGLAGD